MTERQINERRNWKAETFPYDYFFPDETPECQYCLTEKQAEILRGILQPLAWKTRWWSDTDVPIDQDTIESYRDDIVRRLMMSCCNEEFAVIFRWTVDGVLEQSDDGGETWEDASSQDPRNSSTVYPPVEGDASDDKKCIAATGAVLLIKEQVGDQLTDDMSRFTLGELISTWVTSIIQSSNPFQALINVAVAQIFALVIAVIRPALTTEVYHQLECILFCEMSDDLSFTEGQWTTVRDRILEEITGIAGFFLVHLVALLGKVGLTNLVRSQAATEGDCSDCDCPLECVETWSVYPSGTDDYGFIDSVDPDTGVLTGHSADHAVGGNYYFIIQTDDDDACCQILAMPVDGEGTFVYSGLRCGETFPVVGIAINDCVHLIQIQSGLPFTVEINLQPCP